MPKGTQIPRPKISAKGRSDEADDLIDLLMRNILVHARDCELRVKSAREGQPHRPVIEDEVRKDISLYRYRPSALDAVTRVTSVERWAEALASDASTRASRQANAQL
jgi:hypothetical protein